MAVLSVIANTADTSVIRQASETYSTLHDATDGTSVETASGTANYIANVDNGGGTFSIRRYFFYFDISALPSGATISAVSLNLKTAADYTNDLDDDAVLVAGTPADKTSIATADYDQTGGTSFGTGDLSAANTAFSITLNASGLTHVESARASGFAIFALRMEGDFTNTAPSGTVQQVNINSANAASDGDKPTLNITYTTPEGGGFVFLSS